MSYQRPQAGVASKAQLVPYAVYRVLCTKAGPHTSKESGNPSIKVDVQILSPESVVDGQGNTALTAGISGSMYFGLSSRPGEKSGVAPIATTIELLTLLGCPIPEAASTYEEDVVALQEAAAAYLNGLTWEQTVGSKRDVRLGPDRKPLLDSLGRPIQGSEQADFNSFGIVGIPKPLSELSA